MKKNTLHIQSLEDVAAAIGVDGKLDRLLTMAPKWATAKKITFSRILFLILVFLFKFLEQDVLAVIFFTIGACTDFIDGALARHHRTISDWGEFYDPLFDKLYNLPLLIVYGWSLAPIFVAFAVLIDAVSFALSRLAQKRDFTSTANRFGKWKTVSQFFVIFSFLINQAVVGVYILVVAILFGAGSVLGRVRQIKKFNN